MEWLDKSFSDFVTAHRNLEAITGSADDLFDQLWVDVKEVCAAARYKGMVLNTNGSPRSRVVIMMLRSRDNDVVAEEQRRLNIALSQDLRSITAVSDAGTMEFSIQVCPDGVVCFMYKGRRIAGRDGAREIMRAFLFEGKSPYTSQV